MADADLRDLLSTLTPTARDALRRVFVRDQPDRDEVASTLLHYGDRNGADGPTPSTRSRCIPTSGGVRLLLCDDDGSRAS